MAKRKSRKKITFGRALAAGGRVSTTIGVIFSYIGCAIMCIIAIYLMGLGIVGKYPLFESGYCTQNPPPMCGSTQETCTGRGCSWDAESKTCMVTDTCSGIFTNEVWEGCKLEVPFCQELFFAKCDCAVLEMTNYTQRALPESFGGLKSLVKLGVYTGQLEELPQPLGDNHKRMIVLMVIGNKLQSLPDSVGNLQNLEHFYAWNNTITRLPESIGNVKSLIYVDVRHNNLASLPSSIRQWDNLEYLYLAGNPLCLNFDTPNNLRDAKGLCEQQCSVDCPSVRLGDGGCDDNDYNYLYTKDYDPNAKPKPNSGCNIVDCEYDKGDCPRD